MGYSGDESGLLDTGTTAKPAGNGLIRSTAPLPIPCCRNLQSDVTEAEAFEIAQLASANALTAFTVCITFTFGYLAAAYLVGTNLSRTQVVILGCLYVLSATSCVLAHLGYLEAQGAASAQAPTYYPVSMVNDSGF